MEERTKTPARRTERHLRFPTRVAQCDTIEKIYSTRAEIVAKGICDSQPG